MLIHAQTLPNSNNFRYPKNPLSNSRLKSETHAHAYTYVVKRKKEISDFMLTMTKYAATRRNPEEPKARHVRVPSKKAAAMPDGDKPETRTGEPTRKITALLRRADFHVGGDDLTS